ncbi:MAG: hypothetical protein JNM13_13940 [Hyphomicrobiaceae bacterium]|nr:hypothetical protein [Hyphomicrobiaceae bacterium]
MVSHSGSGLFRLALLQAATALSVLALAGLVGLVAGSWSEAGKQTMKWQGGAILAPAGNADPLLPAAKGDRGVFTVGVVYGPASDRVVDAHHLVLAAIAAPTATR